ncbi:hypothetical protein C0991_003361 [Blastosporella zonata]|nr:hypothetical protein C0991_003361 [Blastosporella zonata]
MPDSPTYTAYSPFSSGSSASYPNRSPVSDSFDTSDHHHQPTTMEDFAYPPNSAPLPIYADLAYVQPQDFDLTMMNWAKRPPSFPHSAYRPTSSQELPHQVERMKNLALYIPPTSPSSFRQHSPTIIHSPVPISVPSNAPPQSPSLPSHSPHPLQQSHRPQQHYQDQYFHLELDKWRASPTTSHQAPYPPPYTHTHSHSHSGSMPHGYHSPLHPDSRRSMSEYSPQHSSTSTVRIKQEDIEMYSPLGPYSGHRQRHIFDLSASPPKTAVPTHIPPASQASSSSYYSQPQPLHTRQPSFSVHSADLTPTEPTVTVIAHHDPAFDTPPSDMATYGMADADAFEQAFCAESAFGEVCDPQFVSGIAVEKSEFVDSDDSEQDDEWDAHAQSQRQSHGQRQFDTAEYAAGDGDAAGELVDDRAMADHDADGDGDADADGEDDLEPEYTSAGYPPPPPPPPTHVQRRGESPIEPPEEEDYDNEEDDDLESEEDDMRDSEFVLRRARRPASSSYTEGRSLRSTRYNPYPSSYSASPTADGYMDDYASAGHPHSLQETHYPASSSQPRAPRRSFSHTSVSPTASELYSPVSAGGVNMQRRRSRPTTTLPIPVPVPNLTKKSRGRRVPTMEDFQDLEDEEAPAPAPVKGRKKGASVAKGMRTYTCDVDGCGKLFARGEHLKRHIRSIHTYEKPHRCPYPGCGKDFSRHDNLGQHMRVHKDYVPSKDSEKA